jgi:DNA-binding NarL/FixJ family response regulator
MDHVLIVDDHPPFPAAAEALLRAEGVGVTLAEPDGAVRVADTLEPDLVLLDADLRHGRSDLLASRLSQRHRVVLLAARDREEYASLAARCGASGVLDKAAVCADAVRSALRLAGPAAA